MDDLIRDMQLKNLIYFGNEYEPIRRSFVAQTPQMTCWKFLDGKPAGDLLVLNSIPLNGIFINEN